MSEVNLWIRANLEQPTPETEALIPLSAQERYEEILGGLAAAGAALNEAHAVFYDWQEQREQFFREMGAYERS